MPHVRPMVRGRLVEVNGAPFAAAQLGDERARRLGEREFNLSWSDALPPGNRVVAGQWWKPGETGVAAGASLEAGIAKTLGLKLGDTLTYDIGGTRVSAKVTSLRKVDWDSFRVNFFALFAPGVLDALPKTYISAVRADAGNAAWLTALVRAYPNVLVIDVGEILLPGAVDHGSGRPRSRVRVPVHVVGRGAGARSGDRDRPRMNAATTRRCCAPSARASGS